MRRVSSVDVFGRNMFVRQLMPALISCLTLSLADMADSIVLGRRMGATALAAVSIVIPIYMVFNVIMHALGLGGSIRYSRLMAEHKKDEARSGYKGVIITAIIIGVIIGIIGNLFCETILMGLGTVRSDGEVYTMASIYFRILAFGSPAVMLSYIYNYFLLFLLQTHSFQKQRQLQLRLPFLAPQHPPKEFLPALDLYTQLLLLFEVKPFISPVRPLTSKSVKSSTPIAFPAIFPTEK